MLDCNCSNVFNYSASSILSHLLRVFVRIVDQAEAAVAHEALGVGVVAWLFSSTQF